MSGVEAAASLFGSDDPASDPFGSLGAGNNEVAGESVPQQQHGTVSQQQEQAPGAADLFSGGDSSYPEFGAVGGHSGQQDYSSWPAAQEVNGYNPQDYYQAPATTNSAYVDAQASQVGYGAPPQADYYQPPPTVNNVYAPATYSQTTSNSAYGYAGTNGYTNGTSAPSQHNEPTPTYDPYKPTTTQNTLPVVPSTPSYAPASYQPSSYTPSNSYTPAAPSSSYAPAPAASYAPATTYAPATSHGNASSAPPRTNALSPTYAQYALNGYATQPAAPPSPKAAEVYRPKTLNAYDPPIPPPKVNKRSSSSYRSGSPAVGQQTYPAVYQSNGPTSVPPPPPRTSSAMSHTSTGLHTNGLTPHVPNGAPPTPYGHVQTLPPASVSLSKINLPPPPPRGRSPSTNVHAYSSMKAYEIPHSPKQPHPAPPPNSTSSYAPQAYSQTTHVPASAPPVSSHAHDSFGSQDFDSTSFYNNYESKTVSSSTSWAASEEGEESNGQSQSTEYGHSPYPDVVSEESATELGTSDDIYDPESSYDPEGALQMDEQHSLTQTIETNPEVQVTSATPSINNFHENTISSSPPSSYNVPSSSSSYSYDPYKPDPSVIPASSSSSYSISTSSSNSYGTAHVHDPYQPSAATSKVSSPPSSVRSKSPGAVSAYTPSRGSLEAARSLASPPPPTSYDPYRPSVNGGHPHESKTHSSTMSRVSSPSSISSQAVSIPNPYAPSSDPRQRSMSNGSVYSSFSATAHSPYGSFASRSNLAEASHVSSMYDHPTSNGGLDVSSSSVQTLSAPVYTAYAPSPSLLGTNDPLGRIAGRAPLISFGCGGRLVTCFHGSSTLNTGFDVALSSRQTTGVTVRPLHQIIPESALGNSTASFPGPLFCDPGSPTATLAIRPGASAQTKVNKARVIKYLEDRAEEMSRGLGYLTQGSAERKEADGKLVLMKLLRIMVENDGRLAGSPDIEQSVRVALVSRLANSALNTSTSGGGSATSALFAGPGSEGLPVASDLAYPSLGLPAAVDPSDTILATHTVKASSLDKIQDFLVRGDRRQAYHYALDQRLWAHAMVIASSIDKDAWKEVVSEFIKSEVGSTGSAPLALRGKDAPTTAISGRESLKVAYSLFAGQGAAAVNELVPPKLLPRLADSLAAPATATAHMTPLSPNFPAASVTSAIPSEALTKWAETAAMMIPGPSAADCSAALMALGDCLLANQWVEAAHACYLLAPGASVLTGLGSPTARVPLLGSRNKLPNFHVDQDPIIFSEIAEFAISLAAPQKGQEVFGGFVHLQPYKLIRAASLAEMGHMQTANRYCEAIAATLGRTPLGQNPVLLEQLKGLSDRLIGAPQLDKTGTWMGGKMNRPSLDSIGNWLEGRFTKFIAGDGEGPPDPQEESTTTPFSHFSTISSTASSTSSSPQPTQMNYNVLPGSQYSSLAPPRSGSAQATRKISNPQLQIDRASSAMDYRPRKSSSPVPRIASASAATTTFQQASYGAYSPYGHMNDLSPLPGISDDPSEGAAESADAGNGGDGNTASASWWGSSYSEDSSAPTPTAASFHQLEPSGASDSSGFVSLMDDPALSVSPSPVPAPPPAGKSSLMTHIEEEDDDDLGLGNSTGRPKKAEGEGAEGGSGAAEDAKPKSASAPARPELKTAETGSWFSKWWKKEGGPVKATLGEESSFVYDKDLKRWVNKKAGPEAAKPAAPPPPPSRSQTASPGRSGARMPDGPPQAAHAPPARSASAIDLTSPPQARRSLNRVRSNLVPDDAAPPPPTSPGILPPGTPPPPSSSSGSGPPSRATPPPGTPGRPKSQASKRSVRSRYVDVFQQPEAS